MRDEIVLRSRVPAGALVPLQLIMFEARAGGKLLPYGSGVEGACEFITRGISVRTSAPCTVAPGGAATPLGPADLVREEAVGGLRAGERLTREVRVTFE